MEIEKINNIQTQKEMSNDDNAKAVENLLSKTENEKHLDDAVEVDRQELNVAEEENELNSLELEFARMHNAPLTEDTTQIEPIAPMQTLQKHEDLLALLKDEDSPDAQNSGVRIEGEGDFEFMDIVDVSDESNHEAAQGNKGAKKKLSAEQERALALEQMADLQTRNHRRKQEIKPVPVEIDFITSSPEIVRKVQRISQDREISNNEKFIIPESKTSQYSGFRRMRPIKKKIIFDPDVPETQKSYAQYAAKNTFTPSGTTAIVNNIKKSKVAVPVAKSPTTIAVKTAGAEENGSVKRKTNSRSSEVERLMGDEGAANMLHELNAFGKKRSRTPKLDYKIPATIITKALKRKSAEDSMIISRRSTTSSISSNASSRRQSFSDVSEIQQTNSGFQFAKPSNKSEQQPSASEPRTISCVLMSPREISDIILIQPEPEQVTTVSKNGVTHISITTECSKIPYTFNMNLLDNLTLKLAQLGKDFSCNVVLMTSTSAEFCHGIDILELIGESRLERSHRAKQLSTAIKTYLATLASFPKPIILGISGTVRNLGVMQLPFFDYVVADEECTFESTYSNLEQIPEGIYLWNNTYKDLISRLFFLGERLSTSDSCISKLVHKTVKPSKGSSIYDAAFAVAEKVSKNVKDLGSTIKKPTLLYTDNHRELAEKDFKKLIEIWTSLKFQNKCKAQLSKMNKKS